MTGELPVAGGAARWWEGSLEHHRRRFPGRDAVFVAVEFQVASALDGLAALRAAMGAGEGVVAGDRVVLTPGCLNPIRGEVGYATPTFLGVSTADALYRFYVREPSAAAVGVAHHLFADDASEAPSMRAWRSWLRGLFEADGACLTPR
jgi:hypothetical protein